MLTTAPRTFWKDTDKKMMIGGFETLQLDRCIWLKLNPSGVVVGRVGSHVDDFLITGKTSDPTWQKVRAYLKQMYRWSPWRKGSLTYAGVELAQLTNYSIILGQEDYCNSLELPLPNKIRQAADEEKRRQQKGRAATILGGKAGGILGDDMGIATKKLLGK